MNTKIKYISILIGTLIIGFVIGFLTNGRLVKSRISKMNNFYTEAGAEKAFIRVLDPTKEQMDIIKPILRKYAEQNRELLNSHREEQQLLFTELESELSPYLTEEQQARLENMKTNWRKRFKREGKQGRGSKHRRGEGNGPRPDRESPDRP